MQQQDVRTMAAQAAIIEEGLREDYPHGVVPITSQKVYNVTEHKAGVTIEVPYGVASRHIAKGSHRVATKEEHEAFKADMERRNAEYRQRELDRRIASGPVAILQDGQLKPAGPVKQQPKEVK